MMRKKIVSLCMALALCLGLLPVTALAVEGAPNSLYVGDQQVINGDNTTFWTTDKSTGGLTKYGGNDDNWNVKYDPSTVTLTLKNATIKGVYNIVNTSGSGIYAASSSGPVSLNIVLEEENKVSGMYGIDVSSSGGDASLNISGSGSLTVSGLSGNGIGIFMSSQNSANLTIEEASVTALGSRDGGSGVRLITSQTGSPSLTIEVKGGSLQASGETNGIHFLSNVNGATAVANLKVSGNAMVKASNIITTKDGTGSAPELKPAASGSDGTGGIIWDGKNGTVYGDVTLQEDLTIGKGESLNIPSGASLTIDSGATLTNEGTVTNNGTLTNNGTINNSGTLPDNIEGTAPPSITTTALADGAENTAYNATLEASGDPTSWEIAEDTLPDGLTLNESTGEISGTPTADGTFNFTVKATNTGGSDSEQLSITIDAQTNVPVTGVTLSQTELSLTEGNTAQLTATVKPDDATNKNVTWSSDDTSVATVDATGKVTAVSAGTATITVTTVDGGYKDTCQVTVTAALVPVSGVTLNKDSLALGVGDTETLTATVAPANAANQSVTWASSAPSVATVDAAGKVTAVAPGTATITATTVDGGFTAICTVTVRPYIPPANPNYRITVEATQGGTVTADPTAAKAGATVTLTPAPDAGYQVGSVAVTDRFGDAVAVTEQADGTYTFTMPNGQVTVTVTFEQAPLPFPDVTEGDWFYDAVRYAYETGLMDGVGDSLFAPNSETTRAQLVTILYRLAGQPAVSGDLPFTDVEAGTWYTDAVAWAAENGIVNGTTDTTFAPGDDITREQLVTVLYRYAESKGYDVSASADLSGYPDAGQVQDYAQPAMAWAVAEGIVEGVDGNLNPTGDATRAQIATILMRFCEGVAK